MKREHDDGGKQRRGGREQRVALGAGLGMIFGAAFGAVGTGLVLGAALGLVTGIRSAERDGSPPA